jgi:hypothetical protein
MIKRRGNNKQLTLEDISKYHETVDFETYEREGRLNELPDYPGEPYGAKSEIPEFFYDVVDKYGADVRSRVKFVRKFFLYYYFSDKFKELVKDYCILLLNNQYSGVFKSENEAFEYAISKNVPGRYIDLIPITPVINHEYIDGSVTYGEFQIYNIKKRKRQEYGEKLYVLRSDAFTVNCNLRTNENSKLGNSEKYIIDTGCSTTHLPMVDKWNYYKEEFIEESNKFKNLNENIIKKINRLSTGIGGIKIKKIEVHYSSNVFFLINETEIKGDRFLVKKVIRNDDDDEMSENTSVFSDYSVDDTSTNTSTSSFKDKIVNILGRATSIFEKNKFIIPKKDPDNLLGMNSIRQIYSKIFPIGDKADMLLINNANRNSLIDEISFFDKHIDFNNQSQTKFEIITLNLELHLYRKLDSNEDYNTITSSVFVLRKEALLFEDDLNVMSAKYKLGSNLNFILVHSKTLDNLNNIKRRINNKTYIHGLIYTNINEPYNFQIYVKNPVKTLNFQNESTIHQYEFVKYEDYASVFIIDEINIIKEHRVTSKVADSNFNIIQLY